jgi:hypothetical protein
MGIDSADRLIHQIHQIIYFVNYILGNLKNHPKERIAVGATLVLKMDLL